MSKKELDFTSISWEELGSTYADEIIEFAKNSINMSVEERALKLTKLMKQGYYNSDADLLFFSHIEFAVNQRLELPNDEIISYQESCSRWDKPKGL